MNCTTCNTPGAPHEIIDGQCHRCTAKQRDSLKQSCEQQIAHITQQEADNKRLSEALASASNTLNEAIRAAEGMFKTTELLINGILRAAETDGIKFNPATAELIRQFKAASADFKCTQ